MSTNAEEFYAAERLWKKQKLSAATCAKRERTLCKQLREVERARELVQRERDAQLLILKRLQLLRTQSQSVKCFLTTFLPSPIAVDYLGSVKLCHSCGMPLPAFLMSCYRCNFNCELEYVTRGPVKWTRGSHGEAHLHFVHEDDVLLTRHMNLARNFKYLKSLAVPENRVSGLSRMLPAGMCLQWIDGNVKLLP